MKILFLSRWYPDPPDNGSKIRILSLLRGLCEQHNVTLISFFNPEDGEPDKQLSNPAPDEIHICSYSEFNPHSLPAVLGYLGGTPRYLVDTYSTEMEALIRRAIQKTGFDLVIASQLSMAHYYPCFRGIPAIFEEAELGSYWPIETQATLPWIEIRRKVTWAKHRRFMARVLENFNVCTVVSEVERKLLAMAAPTFQSIHVIPNSIDVDRFCRTSNGRAVRSMIFAGSLRYSANHDAMTWFLRDIYPEIRAEMPDVQLTITGEPAPQPLPPSPNVVLAGKVPDIQSVVARSAISLAPIRRGGGTRLKILESFALRTPVVATTKAVEGLEIQDGEHLLVADTSRDFANAVLQLLREPEEARRMTENAFRLVRARYDWRIVLPRFMELVDQAISVPRHQQPQVQVTGVR